MSLEEQFRKRIGVESKTDVALICKYEERTEKFLCHRRILSKASNFFKKLFSHKCDYLIENAEPNIIFLTLIYIYDGKLETTDWKTIADILIAAISYGITSLRENAIKLLERSLDLSNASSLLELASYYSIPSLYSSSLQTCTDGAFYILDSDDFNWIQPSIVVLIASQPDLNVPSETFVLYCLWIRATIDASRNDVELSCSNIEKYFKAYSSCVEYADISEDELRSYRNEYLMQHFQIMKGKNNKRVYTARRKMTFPLKLPSKFYIHFDAGTVDSITWLGKQTDIGFTIDARMLLIEFRLTFLSNPESHESYIDLIQLRTDCGTLLQWDKPRSCSTRIDLKVNKRVKSTPFGEILTREFAFTLKDLVKLCPTKTYHLRIQTAATDLSCPVMKIKRGVNCPINFHDEVHKCLTNVVLLPYPSVGNYE